MNLKELRTVQKELAAFVEFFRTELGRSERRHWCGMYLSGLMLDGERKSVDPMAQRLEGGDTQAMSQFLNQSPWAFEPVQARLREFFDYRFKLEAEDGFLILDDTTFPKKGKHSVGVAHQYCGALGKQANCQTLVSWQFASPQIHFPLSGELYLPESWTLDPRRMKRVGVPERRFQFRRNGAWHWSSLIFFARIFLTKGSCVTLDMDKVKSFFMSWINEESCFWLRFHPT